MDIKKEWKFLNELKNLNYVQNAHDAKNNKQVDNNNIVRSASTDDRLVGGRRSLKSEGREIGDPLKVRLTKGEISRIEYNELYNTISS